MKKSNRKTVGLVACGSEPYRKYLLEQMASEYDVWLFLAEDISWQQPYITGFTQISSYSNEALASAVNDVMARGNLSGLVCWDERYIIATADVAALVGLRSAGCKGIRGCRDKALSRELMRGAGLLQPKSQLCLTAEQAIDFAAQHRFPLVVKPRGMGGSIGVAMVSDEAQLRARFSESFDVSNEGAVDFKDSVLIEEYLSGPEISVDGYCIDGRYQPLFIARKRIGMHPHFEETGHTVDSNDPLLNDPLLVETLERAHHAILFENGITHTELKLTSEGYVIVEINGRLGGDLIPYLASLAMNIKPGVIAAKVACGDDIDFRVNNDQVAVIEFKYPAKDIYVEEINIHDDVHNLPGVKCVTLATKNTFLALPPTAYMSRAAFVITVDNTEEKARALTEWLINSIEIIARTEPVPVN